MNFQPRGRELNFDLSVLKEIPSGAIFDRDAEGRSTHRYVLWRRAYPLGDGICVFVMLNPSTADASKDDPTLRRCIGFTKLMSFEHLIVLNLYAYQATKPAQLWKVPSRTRIGTFNRDYVMAVLDEVWHVEPSLLICGWGASEKAQSRGVTFLNLAHGLGYRPMCLGMTKDGAPRHPLYVSKVASIVPYELGRPGMARA